MLVSSKWEKQRLEPHSHKIVNVPLPSQQATKILRDLQISCNSSNKRTQIEALQCWEAWINSHSVEDWETDSICHFAMKPLITKKIYTLHKDSDICKLKLNIMWNLLATVEKKMNLDGPKHILDNFLQSCFTWMASIEHLENVVYVLIIKLLFALFNNNTDTITCDQYTFPSIEIAGISMDKQFYSVIDKFLDIFENWKKVEDNKLIINIWTWFLDKCESAHNTIATTVWHRIFKINQAFCSEKSEPVTERLAFLHACATTVKTVLISSKYIGGESCFVTPCEALFKKLPEICSAEDVKNSDPDHFRLCRETSKTLAFKSMEICDYDLCIHFLDSMEDFSLKSFAWGCWCGLVDCFERNFSSASLKDLKKKEMKFFRKLRSSAVNFELDRHLLDETSVAIVLCSMKLLKIGSIGTIESLNSPLISNLNLEKSEPLARESPEEKRGPIASEETLMDVDVCPESKALVPVQNITSSTTMNLINVFDESDKILSVTFDTSGRFSHFNMFLDDTRRTLKVVKFQLDFNLVKNLLGNLKMEGIRFPQNGLDGYRLTPFNKINNLPAILPQSDIKNRCLSVPETVTKVDEKHETREKETKSSRSSRRKSRETNENVETTPKRTITTRRASLNAGKATETGNVTPRTRRRLKMEMEAKAAEETSGTPTKRNRKSFEAIIHEILEKNKIKKTDVTNDECEESTGNKRNLRKRKGKVVTPANEETLVSKEGKNGKEKKKAEVLKKSAKEDEKTGKVSTNGKLENFFKVINTPNSENSECKSVGSPKCETPRRWSKRGKKGSDNMRQISLKTMMKDNEDKIFENKEVKVEREVVTDKKIKTTPLKETYSDHEYAKTCELHQVLLENSNLIESPERRAKRSMNQSPEKAELENIDPNSKELMRSTLEEPEKETPMEIDEEVESQDFKDSKPSAAETIEENSEQVPVPECLIPVNEPRTEICKEESVVGEKVDECLKLELRESDLVLVEAKQETKATESESTLSPTSEVMKKEAETEKISEKINAAEKGPEKIDASEQVPEKTVASELIPEKSDTLDQSHEKISSCEQKVEENSPLESVKPADSDLNKESDECQTEEGTKGKKRSFITSDPDETKSKKMKLINESSGSGAEISDTSSPVKTGSQSEVSSPKSKSESASPRTLKMVSRAISSRTSRMIALVPDPVPGSQVGKVESPTQPPHVLNVSPKVDAKDKSRKFIGADRNSRVSKMLASLSKQMVKEAEDVSEEDKTFSNLNTTTNTNGNSLTPKIISPNPLKKKKFIGFDESKNQTVIYRINTPPSQVLEEWKLIREEYLSSQEAEASGETEGDSGSWVKTTPVRTWPTKKSRHRMFLPDTDHFFLEMND